MKKNTLLIFTVLFLLMFEAASAQITLSLTPSNHNGYAVSCFGGSDGQLTVTVMSGGTSPYEFLWSNGATTQSITDLTADYYSVTVTDANANTATEGVNINSPKPLKVSLSSPVYGNEMNVSCYNCVNASISSIVNEGVSPYAYLWLDGPATSNRSGLGSGAYKLKVTDANGCIAEEKIAITEPDRDDWALSGNTGINPANQFIGTSDNKDLVFKTNASERLRIEASGDIAITGNLRINNLSSTSTFNPVYIDEHGVFHAQGPGGGGAGQNVCAIPLLGAWFQPNNTTDDIYRCIGNVGIGITNTSHLSKKLVVNGSVRLGDEVARNGLEIISNTSTTTPVIPPYRAITIGYDDGGTEPDGAFNFWINKSQSYEGSGAFNFKDLTTNQTLLTINSNGKVGIGVNEPDPANWCPTDPDFLLWVRTGIRTEKLKVDLAGNNNWYDHVFSAGYEKKSLSEVEQYIKEFGHLPEIPSASEVKENGIDVGEMIGKLLQKVEEITLDAIHFEKELEKIRQENNNLRSQIKHNPK